MVAWHEKVDSDGFPSAAGSPRIVWKYSKTGGTNWSQRKAIAMDHPASPPGLGHFNPARPPDRPAAHSRSGVRRGDPEPLSRHLLRVEAATGLSANGWVGGYDRVLDLRGVLIDATTSNGTPVVNPSFQVSRYPYRPLLANETPKETLDYVEPICPTGGTCYPGLNYSGRPHTGGGTSPFLHDYNVGQAGRAMGQGHDIRGVEGRKEREDVPFAAGFGLAWADNRNVVEPTDGAPAGARVAELRGLRAGRSRRIVRESRLAKSGRDVRAREPRAAAHRGDELQAVPSGGTDPSSSR